MSAPRHAAPRAVRARVLEAVRALPAPGGRTDRGRVIELPRPRGRAPSLWAYAAAAGLFIVSMVQVMRMDRLRADLAASRAQTGAVRDSLAAEREWSALLASPATRRVTLAPTPAAGAALAAQVLYDPRSNRAIVLGDSLAAPTGHDYELWILTASGPTSLGVVHPDAGGHLVARLTNVHGAEAVAAFAVSLEASGGSPDHHKPSGPVVMVGKLAG